MPLAGIVFLVCIYLFIGIPFSFMLLETGFVKRRSLGFHRLVSFGSLCVWPVIGFIIALASILFLLVWITSVFWNGDTHI